MTDIVTSPARYRVRAAAAALAVAGILFALYPALRPYTDETTLDGARAFASTAWIVSHALGMLGFIGLAVGLLGLHVARAGAGDSKRSFLALLMTWIGAGLVLSYYGAEAYGLRVVGRLAVRTGDAGLLDLAHQIRFGPGVVLFGAGLVLLAAAGIMTALTAARDRRLVRWGGVLTGICLALYLPQFFGPPPVRIAHGVLLAVGCLWLAAGLWIRRTAAPARAPVSADRLSRAVPAPRAPYWDGAG